MEHIIGLDDLKNCLQEFELAGEKDRLLKARVDILNEIVEFMIIDNGKIIATLDNIYDAVNCYNYLSRE